MINRFPFEHMSEKRVGGGAVLDFVRQRPGARLLCMENGSAPPGFSRSRLGDFRDRMDWTDAAKNFVVFSRRAEN